MLHEEVQTTKIYLHLPKCLDDCASTCYFYVAHSQCYSVFAQPLMWELFLCRIGMCPPLEGVFPYGMY